MNKNKKNRTKTKNKKKNKKISTNNPLFYVRLKKEARKQIKGAEKKEVYPVYYIETEENTGDAIPKSPIDILRESYAKKGVEAQEVRERELTIDDDDLDEIEDELEKSVPDIEVIVWLLVGDKKNHKLVWVDANDTWYLG